jgi:hypothetical protein
MAEPIFRHGQIYKRSSIHDLYGGNRQGGISPSAKNPYIFIFSLKTGHQHGYKDQWENSDIFSYSGEGQMGDMEFVRGNLALKDHLLNGKRVFLFTEDKRSFVKFETELELIDFGYFEATDKSGNERRGIKFFFKKEGAILNYEKESELLISEPEVGYSAFRKPNETERRGLVTSRVGQGAYRKSILYRWEFKCAVTSYSKPEILIASHIVPWKSASSDERLDVDNGILLSPTYDALFDQNLISFENNGKIILSNELLNTNYSELGVTGQERISKLSVGNKEYLERHRENVF